MPTINAKLSTFVFETDKFAKDLDQNIRSLYQEAARKFVQIAVPLVPVRTGFARGAFAVLEQFAGTKTSASTKVARIRKQIEESQKRGRQTVVNLRQIRERQHDLAEEKVAIKASKLSSAEKLKRLASVIAVERQLKTLETRAGKRISLLTSRLERLGRAESRLKTEGTLHSLGGQLAKSREVDIERPQHFKPKKDRFGKTRSAQDVARIYRKKVEADIRGEKRAPMKFVEFYSHSDGTKTIKTPTSGQNFASLDFRNESDNYVFEFKIDISYFDINDEFPNRFTLSAPWRSFSNGRAAMLDHLRKGLKDLPKVLSYWVETQYIVSAGGGVTKSTRNLVV